MPVIAVGLCAGGHDALQIQRGGLTLGYLGAIKLQLANVVQALLVFFFQARAVQLQEIYVMAQICRGTRIIGFFIGA